MSDVYPCIVCNRRPVNDRKKVCSYCVEAWHRKSPRPVAAPAPSVIAQADALINGDRDEAYGPWSENADKLAALWSDFLGVAITPLQATAMLALLKIMRLSQDPTHRDSWIDLAGYAGCAGKLLDQE